MADKSSDLVQGTLEMLILKTLALEPMHGYGVAVRIACDTVGGAFRPECRELASEGVGRVRWQRYPS
jgi:DNA-binding PadR family transcriptional regulator